MRKNSNIHSDEIDLSPLLKTIWKEKIKIILITLVTTIIFAVNNKPGEINNKVDLYEITVNVKPSKVNLTEKFSFINEILFAKDAIYLRKNLENQLQGINRLSVFKRFIEDIMYHDELITVLKKSDTFKRKNSQLSEDAQEIELYKLTKLFTLKKDETETSPINYNLKFQWHDVDEGIQIIDETLKLGLKNIKVKVFSEVKSELQKNIKVENERNQKIIEFLEEQSAIAKALNIKEGKAIVLNGDDTISNEISNSKNTIIKYSNSAAHYLRGYKAIQMEINFLKNRKYKYFDSIIAEINSLKIPDKERWVYYNIFSVNAKPINIDGTELIIHDKSLLRYQGVLFGIIIGLFYAFIIYLLQAQKVTREKKSN